MSLYRGMDRAALDAAYNNGKAVKRWPAIKEDWEARSRQWRAERSGSLDIAYGPGPRQRLDWFPAATAPAPVLVFVHGGYWQWNDKETFAFIAEGGEASGLHVAVIEYTLAPAARIGAIVDEIGQAITCIETLTALAGSGPSRLVLAGHSAGGHLIAHHRARPSVALAVPISGVFDLAPVALSFIDEPLGLTHAEIEDYSPIRHIGPGAPLILTVGADELSELRRQTRDFEHAARAAGENVTMVEAPGRDHFTILEDLAAPDGRLLDAILRALQ